MSKMFKLNFSTSLQCTSISQQLTSNCFRISEKFNAVFHMCCFFYRLSMTKRLCYVVWYAIHSSPSWIYSPIYPLLHMMIVCFSHRQFISCYIHKCLVSLFFFSPSTSRLFFILFKQIERYRERYGINSYFSKQKSLQILNKNTRNWRTQSQSKTNRFQEESNASGELRWSKN